MNTWIISGAILLAGLFICLILILRVKWKTSRKNIKDYEEGRDKLTYRKKKEEPKEELEVTDGFSFPSLTSLMTGILTVAIILAVGVVVLGETQTVLTENSVSQNVTSETLSEIGGMSNLILVVMAVAIGIGVIGVIINAFVRGSGGEI